jgi:catechol 2,3-dioxygenase-like lactoylglutathione lyase family enzyme
MPTRPHIYAARATERSRRVALQVSAVAVPVADQTRASRFYQRALGFILVTDRTVQGWRWVSLLPPAGSCAIGLVRAQHAGCWTGISLLTDITTLYQQWRRHGVAFDGPPARQAWGARTALFADLDLPGEILAGSPPRRAVLAAPCARLW